MKSFFVAFTWKLRSPAKYFNSGGTVIAVDAVNEQAAKQEARHRFPDKVPRFTCVKEFETSSLITDHC